MRGCRVEHLVALYSPNSSHRVTFNICPRPKEKTLRNRSLLYLAREGQTQQRTGFLTVTYYLSTDGFPGRTSNSVSECREQPYRNSELCCLAKARNNLPFSDAVTKPTPAASLRWPRTPRHAALGPGRCWWERGETFPTPPRVPGHRGS